MTAKRFIVERPVIPVADLVPLEDPARRERPATGNGFLTLLGAFEDAPEFTKVLDDVVNDRGQ